jgi:hypothetical protein
VSEYPQTMMSATRGTKVHIEAKNTVIEMEKKMRGRCSDSHSNITQLTQCMTSAIRQRERV